ARLLGAAGPTAEQAAVISAPAQPLAVIAGAGSGKSETMAARLVWRVANGMVRPERVLGLTFTRKAAAELDQRVRTRLDGLRRAGLRQPGSGQPGLGTGEADGVPDGGPMDAVSWTPAWATAAVLTLAGELAEHLRSPGEVREVGEWLTAHAAAL